MIVQIEVKMGVFCYLILLTVFLSVSETMEDWDQETLEKVVESKKSEYNQNKPTEIVRFVYLFVVSLFTLFVVWNWRCTRKATFTLYLWEVVMVWPFCLNEEARNIIPL